MKCLYALLAIALALPAAWGAEAKIETGSVVVVPVSGMVSEAQFFFLRRVLKKAEAAAAAGIIFNMDTPGGDLKATEKIVQMLSKSPIPAFTYVNTNAGSAGALIAMGTKKIYMAPVSAIGAAAPVAGSGQEIPATMNAKIVSYFSGYFRSVAQKNGYHPELVDGFMNLDKEVKIEGEVINPKGALLTLSAQEASRVIGGKPLLASGIAADVEEVASLCGLAKDKIVKFEPSGFENIAQWITMLAPILLLGGVVGAYLEFKAPGFGVAGIISGICFALFFGGHYIAGLTGLEMAALFVLGIVFILLEILLFPGVVVLALGGSLLVLVALFFAMADFYPAQPVNLSFDFLLTPMLNISIALIGAVFFIAFLARFLPEMPIMRRLFLSFSQPRTIPEPFASPMPGAQRVYPGDTGEALTILRPAGRARIGGEPVDVMTGGDFIEAGTPVRVLSVTGTTIVVGRNG